MRNVYAEKISMKTQHGELKCTPTFFAFFYAIQLAERILHLYYGKMTSRNNLSFMFTLGTEKLFIHI